MWFRLNARTRATSAEHLRSQRAVRGEFQECGYECCIAMSHRRRHHLLAQQPMLPDSKVWIAAQHSGATVQKPKGPNIYELVILL